MTTVPTLTMVAYLRYIRRRLKFAVAVEFFFKATRSYAQLRVVARSYALGVTFSINQLYIKYEQCFSNMRKQMEMPTRYREWSTRNSKHRRFWRKINKYVKFWKNSQIYIIYFRVDTFWNSVNSIKKKKITLKFFYHFVELILFY